MNGPAGASSMVVYQAPPIGLVRVAYRRRGAAALLALLLGSVGAHKFYTGRPVLGVIYFMAFWTGIPLLLGVLEAARYLMMSRQAFDLEYNARLL
jgi:TM2 domain-containing membrane protein YozV